MFSFLTILDITLGYFLRMVACYSLLRYLLAIYLMSPTGSLKAYRLIVHPMLAHTKLIMHAL